MAEDMKKTNLPGKHAWLMEYAIYVLVGVVSFVLAYSLISFISLVISIQTWMLTGEFSLSIITDYEEFSSRHHGEPLLYAAVLVLVFLSFVITHRIPDLRGASVDNALKAYHLRAAYISAKNVVSKIIATGLLIGGGGQVGLLGPGIYIGGGSTGIITWFRKMPFVMRRRIFIAGIAGVLAAVFRSPLGAAIYALEAPYHRDLETDSIIPAIISSITSYSLAIVILGPGRLFNAGVIGVEEVFNPLTIVAAIILGIVAGLSSRLWTRIYRHLTSTSSKSDIRLMGLIIGFIIVLLYMLSPYYVGTGTLYLQKLYNEPGSIMDIVVVALITRFLLSISIIAVGGSGGLFGPGIVVGGLIGYIYASPLMGVACTNISRIMILVGMASFYGGLSTTPIGTSIIVAEISGGYHLIPLLMLSSLIAREIVDGDYIYVNQRDTRLHKMVQRLRDLYEYIIMNHPEYHEVKLSRYKAFYRELPLIDMEKIESDPRSVISMMIIEKKDVIGVHREGVLVGIATIDNLVEYYTTYGKLPIEDPLLFPDDTPIDKVVDEITRRNRLDIIIYSSGNYYVLFVEDLFYALAFDFFRTSS